MQITREEFLRAVFGDDYIFAHVTGFPDDPSCIPDNRRLKCWGGGYWRDRGATLVPGQNLYYAISSFYADAEKKARRRKNLFRCTHVIVADDVKEKLPIDRVNQLPLPSYKLETSPGSEQWGYILDVPCTDMAQVDNLLDGLVAQGLAPSGKDPGMKGVTRYVRLPEGANTKASRVAANGGVAPPCRMLEWHPERKYSMEQLAAPFLVDLNAKRREVSLDGAGDVDDHPLLDVPDLIVIKERRSAGRYDITCPWVENHTGQADDGAAIFTNKDGSFGFKCHHGSCQDKTGRHLMEFIEASVPGFRERMRVWQALRNLAEIPGIGQQAAPAPAAPPSFLYPRSVPQFLHPPTNSPAPSYQDLVDAVRRLVPGSNPAIEAAYTVLDALDDLDLAKRLEFYSQLREHMGWTKNELQRIVDDRRKARRVTRQGSDNFYDAETYVAAVDQFYHHQYGRWLTTQGFQNNYCHIDEEARVNALVGGRCRKVDNIDFIPGMPAFWTGEDGATYINAWREIEVPRHPGDVTPWLNHFDMLGWTGEQKKHVLQWMAFTLRHPERKINHILLLAGGEGVGKDWLLLPLSMAMGKNAKTMAGEEFLESFNEYVMGVKYLQVNESEHGDHKQATMIYNKIKPLACSPPDKIPVNMKMLRRLEINNIINMAMTSNSALPLKVSQDTRRLYALWTDVTVRNMPPGYWPPMWTWMRDQQAWRHCAWYLYTQVDLSDFDPGAVPKPTEFLNEMREHSQDPVSARIKHLIENEELVCAVDLVTTTDLVNALKFGSTERVPTAQVVGKIVKQYGLGQLLRGKHYVNNKQVDLKMYCIRNHARYSQMGPTEWGAEYHRQHAALAAAGQLTAIKGGAAA